jgi:hypothetical protein
VTAVEDLMLLRLALLGIGVVIVLAGGLVLR